MIEKKHNRLVHKVSFTLHIDLFRFNRVKVSIQDLILALIDMLPTYKSG